MVSSSVGFFYQAPFNDLNLTLMTSSVGSKVPVLILILISVSVFSILALFSCRPGLIKAKVSNKLMLNSDTTLHKKALNYAVDIYFVSTHRYKIQNSFNFC